jgi:hypothetical protein
VVLGCFGLLLAVLPLQQPFWLMSVYPLIALILAATIVDVITQMYPSILRLGFAGAVVLAFGWLGIGLVRVYPMFGYYGYEWMGDRWLGVNSKGYRALVVVTNDGSTEAIDWLRQNVPTESFVLSYLNDIHLMKYLERTLAFPFEMKHALHEPDVDLLTKALKRADFVVVRCVDDSSLPPPMDDPVFIQHFVEVPVYQVVRGQGNYRMPVIQIYKSR